jgi:ATP-dependent RNA helicase DeaD
VCSSDLARRRRRRERGDEAPRSADAPRAEVRDERRDEVRLDVPADELRRTEQELPRAPEALARPVGDVRDDEDDSAFSNVFLNIGRRDGTRVGDILRLFEQSTGLGKDALGRIRIRDRHSFVAVPTDRVEDALGKLAGVRYGEKELVAEIARAERGQPETPEV